jgi:phage protein U
MVAGRLFTQRRTSNVLKQTTKLAANVVVDDSEEQQYTGSCEDRFSLHTVGTPVECVGAKCVELGH